MKTNEQPNERAKNEFESLFSNMLHAAWVNGWASCRDSEFAGDEAMNDAFNNCDTLALCIAIDQSKGPNIKAAALLEADAQRPKPILHINRDYEVFSIVSDEQAIVLLQGAIKQINERNDWPAEDAQRPAMKPLTKEAVQKIVSRWRNAQEEDEYLVRMTEQAHGIKGQS